MVLGIFLGKMNYDQLVEYDSFLDENDWDIYYWATQDSPEDLRVLPARRYRPVSCPESANGLRPFTALGTALLPSTTASSTKTIGTSTTGRHRTHQRRSHPPLLRRILLDELIVVHLAQVDICEGREQ
jgi:hypothetical protein